MNMPTDEQKMRGLEEIIEWTTEDIEWIENFKQQEAEYQAKLNGTKEAKVA